MTIVAEWIGGPWDGAQVALQDHRAVFRFALPLDPPSPAAEALETDPSPAGPAIRELEVRPTHTANGWRLYWPKGCS